MTDTGVLSILRNCNVLRVLRLAGCTSLKGDLALAALLPEGSQKAAELAAKRMQKQAAGQKRNACVLMVAPSPVIIDAHTLWRGCIVTAVEPPPTEDGQSVASAADSVTSGGSALSFGSDGSRKPRVQRQHCLEPGKGRG